MGIMAKGYTHVNEWLRGAHAYQISGELNSPQPDATLREVPARDDALQRRQEEWQGTVRRQEYTCRNLRNNRR